MMELLSEKLKKYRLIFFAALAVAALSASLVSGCGGGGGGGGGGGSTGGGGGGGGSTDTTAPTLSVTSPVASASVSDVDFATTAFVIRMSYTDNSTPPSASSIIVTITMDGGTPRDVSAAFSAAAATPATTISSGASLYTLLFGGASPIFILPANDKPHTMQVHATARDAAGNPGFASSSFSVYPVAPPL